MRYSVPLYEPIRSSRPWPSSSARCSRCWRPGPLRVFLALVAVFSGYLAFSGYRVLSRKRPADEPEIVDRAAAGSVVLACLALGGWGVTELLDGVSFGVVMVVFGGIGLTFGVSDVHAFRTGGGRGGWTVTYLQRMVGAFIATVSAVSAVNLIPQLGVVAWLWPTAVGVPLVVYRSRTYTRA